MGKGKLAKFADMETYENVFQYPFSVIENVPFEMKGHWHEQYFHNNNPIVLELGCGKGEYTVELAKLYPDMNFIGVDIKGARMWTGATQALNEGLKNVAFLRTNIEIIERFFAEDEVQEIWLTFSDPQMKNPRKRLTSTYFMNRYRKFLVDGGVIHLKTDSNFLFTYSTYMVEKNALPVIFRTEDLYHDERIDSSLRDHGAQRLRKRDVFPSLQYAAARKLTHAWDDERHGIAQENGVDANGSTRLLSYRLQRLLPAPSAESLCQYAERKREQHPCPIHFVEHHVLDALPILTTIHPIENCTAQDERHQNFGYGLHDLHCMRKGTINNCYCKILPMVLVYFDTLAAPRP